MSAEKAMVLDAATGRVLYEKNADDRSLIASTTKIMTALVVCRRCNVLDRVKIPAEAVGFEGSSMYLREGEVLTVQELLYGLMLRSGNDAAAAVTSPTRRPPAQSCPSAAAWAAVSRSAPSPS